MPQYSFDPNLAKGLPGEFVRGQKTSIANPVNPQITDADVNGQTTDGTYTVSIKDRANGVELASFSYVAASKTAAQIAAGLSAAALADPATRGLLNDTGSDVQSTDHCRLYFRKAGQSYNVTFSSDPSSSTAIGAVQAAGYTAVDPGNLIQSDDAGGFEQWTGDGPALLGVVLRNSELVTPDTSALDTNSLDATIDGPSRIDIGYDCEVMVQLAAGETVAFGDGPAAYDDATKTWKKNAGGDWVIVEGTQWRSDGSGVQKLYVPSVLTA